MLDRDVLEHWVSELDEDKFRKLVLLPLFKALGYHNVIHYHGGPKELGKDIVMWKKEDFQERINYAVIVKAGKLTGSVSGKGSVSEIATQVRQALNSTFTDEDTLQLQSINRCLIAVNTPVKKEAVDAINADLGDIVTKRLVSFYSFNTMIDNCLIHNIGLNSIDSIMKMVDIKDPQKRIKSINITRIGENEQAISIGFSSDIPLEDQVGSFSLKFPNASDEDDFRDKLNKFKEYGIGFEIPKAFISDFSPPNFLKDFSNFDSLQKMEIFSPEISKAFIFDFIVEKDNIPICTLLNLNFSRTSYGSKRAILEYSEDSPFNISLQFNIPQKVNLSYSLKPDVTKYTVVEIYKYYKFLQSLYSGGILIVKDTKTQIKIFTSKLEIPNTNSINPFLVELYEKASFIQTKTGTPLFISNKDFTATDITDINELYNIVHTGNAEFSSGSISITLDNKSIVDMVPESTEFINIHIKFERDEVYHILNADINLGRVIYYIEKGTVKYQHESDDSVTAIIGIDKDHPIKITYMNYFNTSDTNKPAIMT